MVDIKEHYGLIGWVINRYFAEFLNRYPTFTYEDLFNEGVIALLEASERFLRYSVLNLCYLRYTV